MDWGHAVEFEQLFFSATAKPIGTGERRVQGQVNVPLNARGLVQARRAGEMLRGKGIQTICSSPLDRALITAEIIAAHIHVPIVVIDALKECRFGVQEGSVEGHLVRGLAAGITPEGAECYGGFSDRAWRVSTNL